MRSIKVVDFTHGKKDSDKVNTDLPFTDNFKESKSVQSANVVMAGYIQKNINDIARLEYDETGIKEDIERIDNEITNINGEITTIENDITDINIEINNISGELAGKQDTLVSGTNIKTINGNSILGSGNLVIESGSGDYNDLTNKPSINSVSLVGNKTLDDLDIQSKITAVNKIPYSNISDTPDLTYYAELDELNTFGHTQTIKSQMYSGLVLENGDDSSEFVNLGYDGFRKNSINFAWGDIATKNDVNAKQDTLVSGDNIKTVNGVSLLGSGNIDISSELTGRIVEQGDANNGHYIKYDTGIMICTKELSFTNRAVVASYFAGTYGTFNNMGVMPHTFHTLWAINATARPSNTTDWMIGNIYGASVSSMGQARICRPGSAGNISGTVSVIAIGTWK